MIWVAWRQQRAALLGLAAYAACVGAFLLVWRYTATSRLADAGLRDCLRRVVERCAAEPAYWETMNWFSSADGNARMAAVGFAALAGAFLGAPLFAREWEQRTHLLALGQSVGRGRWFGSRVLVALGATSAVALLLGLLNWGSAAWQGDTVWAWERLHPNHFESQPVALTGYALFAVALGATAGLLLRRTLPAMAVAFAGTVAALYAVRSYLREHYAAPVVSPDSWQRTHTWLSGDPGRWVLDHGVLSTSGEYLRNPVDVMAIAYGDCELRPGEWGGPAFAACMDEHGFARPASLVHPGERFWPFQFVEFGLFALIAAALLGVSLVVLRTRAL